MTEGKQEVQYSKWGACAPTSPESVLFSVKGSFFAHHSCPERLGASVLIM